MTAIFGSLGSNYSLAEAGQYMLPVVNSEAIFSQLRAQINQLWPGECFFFYKGRQAITCALVSLDLPPGSGVLLSAFTCYAIEEAILVAGCVPVYADIAINSTNAGVTELQAAFDTSQTNCKVVIVQHTLGIPADINQIIAWAKDKGMLVIEDLAQAAGAVDDQGRLLGTQADVVILSFGQDKVLDAVSGGACVIKLADANQQQVIKRAQNFVQKSIPVPMSTQLRDIFYPITTWLMRWTFDIKIGQALILLGKKIGLLRSPVLAGVNQVCQMTSRSARLACRRLKLITTERNKREKIANVYQQKLARWGLVPSDVLRRSSFQRFLITISPRQKYIDYLAHYHIHLSDIWYRASVDSGSLHLNSRYQLGDCPRADSLTEVGLNLPTHKQITLEIAGKIADLVLSLNQRKIL